LTAPLGMKKCFAAFGSACLARRVTRTGTQMTPSSDKGTGRGGPLDLGFQLRSERQGDAVHLSLSGELDLSSTDKLDEAIRQAEESDARAIVVDLTELRFMDSTGLSVLLGAYNRNREEGRRLSFVPSKHEAVTRLLAITETTEMLDSY
jgi:anti-sigma B factor antagonist